MKKNAVLIFYSYILTVFVVWLHAGEPLFSFVPGQIAVPGFFMVSGYLFMQGLPGPGDEKPADPRQLLTQKLKRRVRTLLIPYLAWNTIYFCIALVLGKAQLSELLPAVFLYRLNPVFWYMFQLILITVLAPVLWWILKEKRRGIAFLAVSFLLAVFYAKLPFHYCNEDALFYYSLGAFLSLHVRLPGAAAISAGPAQEGSFVSSEEMGRADSIEQPDAVLRSDNAAQPDVATQSGSSAQTNGDKNRHRWYPSGCVFVPLTRVPKHAHPKSTGAAGMIVTAVLTAAFLLAGPLLPPSLRNVSEVGYRAAGAITVYLAADLIYRRAGSPELPPWMCVSFFLYATHYLVIRLVWLCEQAAGLNGSRTANAVTYLLMPVICTAAAYGLSCMMKKYVPKVYSVLTGGR